MTKKLVRAVAVLQTSLEDGGLPFEDAQRVGEYFLLNTLLACKAQELIPFEAIADSFLATVDEGFCISGLFLWSQTPEGWKYWDERYNLINGTYII